MEPQLADLPLREQLNDPEITESLARLLGRVGDLETLVSRAADANAAVDGLLATATDVVDEKCTKISETGTPVDQRLGSLVTLLLKLTEPDTAAALGRLLDSLPQLAQAIQLVDQVPNLLAVAADVFDEFATDVKSNGVDLEKSITQGLHALLWLGCRVSEEELERLGFLLRSDVLDPHALEVVGHAASSLANCQRETCALEEPDHVGLFGLLKAARDPQVQHTLNFVVRFARCFGRQYSQPANGKQSQPQANRNNSP